MSMLDLLSGSIDMMARVCTKVHVDTFRTNPFFLKVIVMCGHMTMRFIQIFCDGCPARCQQRRDIRVIRDVLKIGAPLGCLETEGSHLWVLLFIRSFRPLYCESIALSGLWIF